MRVARFIEQIKWSFIISYVCKAIRDDSCIADLLGWGLV